MSEKKITIGIPGWKTGENSYGCGVNHLDYISRFGNPRILFPQDDNAEIDLLYLPGGPDVNPAAYGQMPGFYTSNQDVFKQYFYDRCLPKYIERGTPVFGVCLGMQMLNTFFGGGLHQDMKYHAQSKDRWEPGHEVTIVIGNKKYEVKVNSHHHQAVLSSDLAKDFIPIAFAKNEEDKKDDIIEAFIHKELPIAGVQWHPEEWRDEFAESLIKKILQK